MKFSEIQGELKEAQEMVVIQAGIIANIQAENQEQQRMYMEDIRNTDSPKEVAPEALAQVAEKCNWGSETGSDTSCKEEKAAHHETQDVEGNASQEDNAGFSKCINGVDSHCYLRKEVASGVGYCSTCISTLTVSCGHCEKCNDFVCLPCMK